MDTHLWRGEELARKQREKRDGHESEGSGEDLILEEGLEGFGFRSAVGRETSEED